MSAGGVVKTDQEKAINVCHQFAHVDNGKFIHFSAQFEHCENEVDDRSCKVEGKQAITTLNGHHISLNTRNGLSHVTMRPHTDKKWDALPHVVMTSDSE